MEGDHVYFTRRAQEEREAAMRAPHPAARLAHLDMADRYHELATAIVSHYRMVETSGPLESPQNNRGT